MSPRDTVLSVIDNWIEHAGFVVLDGGLATELERKGYTLDDPLWSAKILLENPRAIYEVHRDYLEAGAKIISTATYQATPQALAARGLGKAEIRAVFQSAVRLADEARSQFLSDHPGAPRPLLAASVGPYGAFLHDGAEFRGDYGLSLADLVDFHRERVELLADSAADLFAFETIPCLVEAEACAMLLQEHRERCGWISFSCRDGRANCQREAMADCAARIDGADQVFAIGVNCTSPVFVRELIEEIKGRTAKRIVVYPNSGETWSPELRGWIGDGSAASYRELAREWIEAGATLIGGCCRTGPAQIRELAALTQPGGDVPPMY